MAALKTARLEDLTTLITKGSSPKWQGINYVDEPGVLFVTSENVGVNKMLFKKIKYVEEAFNERDSKSILVKGDVLTNIVGASIGRTAIFDQEQVANINQAVCLMRCDSEVLFNEYLSYLLNSPYLVKILHDNEINNARANLSLGFFRKLEIPVPPIPEQKRIVALLDTVFADLEQTREKTEQNLKNSRELFDSYLQQVFSQKGEGWVETTLGSEINLLTGFAFKSKEYVTHSNSTPLIRGDNVVQGKLRWDGVKLWSNDTISDYQKYQLEVDDIVIAMDRTWVKAGMKFSKITSEDLPALLVQRVARLRALDSINSDYLYHLVGSKLFESYVLSIQTGLGVPHISGKQIQAFSFNKPDIEQQKIFVSTMNNLKNEVSKLDIIYQKKLAAIDELKKSILQKAFSGELNTTAN
jgi:type I restriction enzyme S subunit